MNRTLSLAACVVSALALGACSSSPPAEVSKSELAEVRAGYGKIQTGMSRDQALGAFPYGNKVKLGATSAGGSSIEEWKVEAYNDEKDRKDLFVTFLYFLDGKLVDSSDSRIMFRENPEIITQWKAK